MKVLSLFDGIACWYEALKRAGIKVDAYYASEIDKYAMQVAMKNHPDIKQLWDVTKIKYGGWWIDYEWGNTYVSNIDLIIWGSPCQWFSVAGKWLNFNDPRSKLFFEFVRLVKEIRPKYFLLENVRMKKEWIDVISEQLFGIEPTLINSSLVSAQNRNRLYWVGKVNGKWWYDKVEIEQPEDRGLLIKDILEDEVDAKYYFSKDRWERILNGKYDIIKRLEDANKKCATLTTCGGWNHEKKIQVSHCPATREFDWYGWKDKCPTLLARDYKDPKCVKIIQKVWDRDKDNWWVKEDKAYCLPANPMSDRGQMVLELPCWTQLGNSKQFGNSFGSQKAYTLRACNPNGVIEETSIRKLTPVECERLQTLPDNYTAGISDSQRYKALGNGWTVEVIKHILEHLK